MLTIMNIILVKKWKIYPDTIQYTILGLWNQTKLTHSSTFYKDIMETIKKALKNCYNL